jgi:5S rRNA maturation endonuclease (ribonuclease M5)
MGRRATGKLEATRDIVFSYVDEEGEIITETVRRNGDKSKTFRRRPNPDKPGRYIYDTKGCRNVLYNLPDIQEAYTVIVVEGEPDADRLTKLGLRDSEGYIVAVTTNSNGAGNWLPEHSVILRKKRVILCGDTDKRGREHMEQVKACLESHLVNVITKVELPLEYKDVSEFLEYRRAKHLAEFVGEDWLEPIDDGIVDV